MKKLFLLGAVAAALFALTPAIAAPPQVTVVSPDDLFQDIVHGGPQVGNVYASGAQLGSFINGLPWPGNVLIGGDATTNLWQRATSGASVTTATTYGGPDRWAYWSGTNTAMTVSKDTTAADLPASGYAAGFKMARTAAQTGVVQVCMGQAIESANAYQLQGQTVELDFHATAGATFTAASSNVAAYIVYGTTADEGVAKMAYSINAGGGGTPGWTGGALATSALIPISTSTGRYAAVATIPTTALEVGVALCFTPVGAVAPATDFVTFAGIQLVRNPGLVASISTTAGYSCTAINCTSFERRPQGVEQVLQQRYFYKLAEVATTFWFVGPCQVSTTSLAVCIVPLPVAMRVAPTMTYTTGFDLTATAAGDSKVACTTLQTSTVLSGSAAGVLAVPVSCASTAGFGAAGTAAFLINGGGSGVINASAEL